LPRVRKLQEIFTHAVNRPNLAYYTQVSDVIQRFVNECLADNIDPKDALKKIEEGIRELDEIYGE
jgi:hypothetical protein